MQFAIRFPETLKVIFEAAVTTEVRTTTVPSFAVETLPAIEKEVIPMISAP